MALPHWLLLLVLGVPIRAAGRGLRHGTCPAALASAPESITDGDSFERECGAYAAALAASPEFAAPECHAWLSEVV